MAVKKCCIEKCRSCSTRREDAGVTYHKFPKDASVRATWVEVTRQSCSDLEGINYVCSLHFLKRDFELYQGCKYVLKSGAVPSLFPWTGGKFKKSMDELDSLPVEPGENEKNVSTSSKDSEPENLEDIRKYLEKHDKEAQEKVQAAQNESQMDIEKTKTDEISIEPIQSSSNEPLEIASALVDFVIDESTDKLSASKDDITSDKSTQNNSEEKASSVALSVGSKVEAKDFEECWYSAEIMEVDYDEMEILVRYDSVKKSEEWISVNSPRLRPVSLTPKPTVLVEKLKVKAPEVAPAVKEQKAPEVAPVVQDKEEMESKSKTLFAVGERCLARWRDNRRFIATVHKVVDEANYEIIFDDGFFWKCSASRLSKLKGSKSDVSDSPGTGPSTAVAPDPAPFHKHLFDPTRDYLGSKSERREQKRKLNIKEIFNIGQKQKRKEPPGKDEKKVTPKRPRILSKSAPKGKQNTSDKKDIPDAIASIIGTVVSDGNKVTTAKESKQEINKVNTDMKEEKINTKQGSTETSKEERQTKLDEQDSAKDDENENESQNRMDATFSDEDTQSAKFSDGEYDDPEAMTSGELDEKLDPIQEEETKLQNFEKPDEEKLNQQVERMKEVIHKLQDGIDKESNTASPKVELKEVVEPKKEEPMKEESKNEDSIEELAPKEEQIKEETAIKSEDPPVDNVIKPEIKVENTKQEPLVPKVMIINMNSKKLLQLRRKSKSKHEGRTVKKTKKVVDTLKSQLENMQMQIDAMQAQIQMKDQALQLLAQKELLESGGKVPEWCCKWYNGEPVGVVVDSEQDSRADPATGALALPRKTIHVQDKRLPEGWKKLMVRRSLGHSAGKWDVVLVSPENRRIHTKSDMRNYIEASTDPAIKTYEHALMDFAIHLKEARRRGWVSEDGKHSGRSLIRSVPYKRSKGKERSRLKHKDRKEKRRKLSADGRYTYDRSLPGTSDPSLMESFAVSYENSTLEDGYVYVGSLKVQVIDNLLRCPADGCFKNFRNNTLLQMHIKHYHRDMRKMLGDTPKVLDLAYARTAPIATETKPRHEQDNKIIKVKFPRPTKREDTRVDTKELLEPRTDTNIPAPHKFEPNKIPRSLDSPIMRQAQQNKPVKRPKVLLPVRRPDPVEPPPEIAPMEDIPNMDFGDNQLEPSLSVPPFDILDFETAISTHTVTRPSKKLEKRKVYGTSSNAPLSEDDEILSMNSDVETRSSFPRSGSPDSKTMEVKATIQVPQMQPVPNDESAMYMYTETGERIKIERMKREEIINCHCGYREEDGLMVQCELCLCWQHAHCYNIQSEADVPKKYTCYICLNPRRGRRSQRHLQDQDRMTEGLLPGGRPSEALRRSHDISAYLLKLLDAINALRLKYHVATKKNHPKLYLWASDWDADTDSQHNPTSFINNTMGIGKENMPVHVEVDSLDIRTSDTLDRLTHEGNNSLLGGLLAIAGGPSLEMPISTSELEKLANSVEEQELRPVFRAPQPEAAIDNAECLQSLMSHLRRCELHLNARLDKLEADIAEIEAQDAMFEDDESPDSFPRTKKTIQMLMRDLETMELLGVLT